MSLKIDRVQLEIVIKNDQSRKQLRELEDQSRQLKKELKKLPEGTEEWTKKFNELKNVQRKMDGLIDKIGLTGLSMKELSQRQRELNAIMNGMDPRLDEYKKLKLQLEQVKGRMAELRGGAEQTGLSLNKIANGFNKYAMIASAFAATTLGLVMGFRKIIDIANEFEKRVDNLSALTGLTGDKLKWLSEQAKDLSTSVIEGNIRITSSATEIVDAYTKVGSKRPELLKVKEDLNAVTQEAMILAAAANGELQPAVDGLTMVLNQFNAPASESRRIINVLAAGSKEGAGEIDYLTAGFEKSGSVAASFGISIEELTGVLETLAPRISEPEMAGRSLRNIMIKLETQSNDKLKPSLVGLSGAFEELHKQQWSVTQLTELFGTENINAANILMNNTAETKKYTAAVTGTSVALEQAGINTDNNASKLAQAKNRYSLLAIELGEKLAPALTFSTNGFTYFMKALMGGIKIFEQYGPQIKIITAGLITYGIAMKVAANWTKLVSAYETVYIAVLYAKEFAVSVLTGKITLATIAQKLWNLAQKANPIGLLITVLFAAGTALALYTRQLSTAEKVQKSLNQMNIDAEKSVISQRLEVEKLIKVARDETNSKADRLAALKKLNEISPEYLGGLTLETVQTLAADEATKKYIESLKQKAKVAAAQEKLIEIEKQLLDLKLSGEGADKTTWAGNALRYLKNYGNVASATSDIILANYQKQKEKEEELHLLREKMTEIIGDTTEAISEQTKVIEQDESTPDKIAGIIPEAWILEGQRNLAELEKLLAKMEAIKAKAAEPIITEEEDIPDVEVDYLIEQYRKTFEGRRAILEFNLKAGLISRAEYNDKMKVLTDDETAFNQEAIDKQKATLQEKFDFAIAVAQKIADVMSGFADAANQRDQNELNIFKANQDKKKELLQKQLDDGIISKESYDSQMDALNTKVEKKEREMANKKAKRQKELSLFNAVISVAEAVAKMFTAGPVIGQILAGITAAMGLIQINTIAKTKVPQYAQGNYADVIGQDDGKTYRAKMGQNKTQLVNGPTFIPGLGLTGEGKKPKELVFSGDDTQKILNSRGLIEAINYTIRAPQFAEGNYPGTITNNNYKETFTDPELIKSLNGFTRIMERIERNGLSVPWNKIEDKNIKMKQLTESVSIK